VVFRGNPFWAFAIEARKVAEISLNGGLLVGIGVKFGVHDRDSAEDKVSDISQDSCTAGGDEVGGKKFAAFVKGVADARGRGALVAVGREPPAEVGAWPEGEMRGGVFGTEADAGIFSQLAAVASGWATVETRCRVQGRRFLRAAESSHSS